MWVSFNNRHRVPGAAGHTKKARLIQRAFQLNWIDASQPRWGNYSPSFPRISSAAVAMTVPGPYTPATPASNRNW